jgi:NAD(P)-dependent dehydrogenase (short-subunit alcohol dehydrogenase family)
MVNFNPDQDIPGLSGQVIIVTGGNVGLGFETIRQLAKHNPARIYLAARSQQKTEQAEGEVGSLREVTGCLPTLDLLY